MRIVELLIERQKMATSDAEEIYTLSLLLNLIQRLVQQDILSADYALRTIKHTGKTAADDNPNFADEIYKLSSFAELAVHKKQEEI
jgi:hypothetical protein